MQQRFSLLNDTKENRNFAHIPTFRFALKDLVACVLEECLDQ